MFGGHRRTWICGLAIAALLVVAGTAFASGPLSQDRVETAATAWIKHRCSANARCDSEQAFADCTRTARNRFRCDFSLTFPGNAPDAYKECDFANEWFLGRGSPKLRHRKYPNTYPGGPNALACILYP